LGEGCQTGEQQGCPDEEVHGGRRMLTLGRLGDRSVGCQLCSPWEF
jgi:hypothetical protein